MIFSSILILYFIYILSFFTKIIVTFNAILKIKNKITYIIFEVVTCKNLIQ